jgi:hypothetical protein
MEIKAEGFIGEMIQENLNKLNFSRNIKLCIN